MLIKKYKAKHYMFNNFKLSYSKLQFTCSLVVMAIWDVTVIPRVFRVLNITPGARSSIWISTKILGIFQCSILDSVWVIHFMTV